ncbi:MAG: hypothetical protein LBU34_18225 [Planctomycetaceae bacterium]|nr:hypothetical protein [Planctomycetaceae bacterium]
MLLRLFCWKNQVENKVGGNRPPISRLTIQEVGNRPPQNPARDEKCITGGGAQRNLQINNPQHHKTLQGQDYNYVG